MYNVDRISVIFYMILQIKSSWLTVPLCITCYKKICHNVIIVFLAYCSKDGMFNMFTFKLFLCWWNFNKNGKFMLIMQHVYVCYAKIL